MQTTYETLTLMLTFGLLIVALLAYLEDRINKHKK